MVRKLRLERDQLKIDTELDWLHEQEYIKNWGLKVGCFSRMFIIINFLGFSLVGILWKYKIVKIFVLELAIYAWRETPYLLGIKRIPKVI